MNKPSFTYLKLPMPFPRGRKSIASMSKTWKMKNTIIVYVGFFTVKFIFNPNTMFSKVSYLNKHIFSRNAPIQPAKLTINTIPPNIISRKARLNIMSNTFSNRNPET